ncbi:aromatic acid exporter family member 1 [Frondihabitans sp. PhB188]|nr:aromatic acid exporter family member 1 [Frondihabitans sp. PhB188]
MTGSPDAQQEPRTLVQMSRSALAPAWRTATARPRLLLAAKTAVAVGIAWAVGPHMPGTTDDYPYYAPLGALISMYPTLMGSARTGLQTLLGLVAGIGLAAVAMLTVGPTWWSIPLVVGIGVLLSGTGWFGAGREYVPMAALFVLIIGGSRAESFSLGYLAQMGVGVAIGLAVNFVVAPAVTSRAAEARVGELEREIAEHLHDVGQALSEPWPPEHEAWSRGSDRLAATSASVRQALADGAESRKGNPRALWRKHDPSDGAERLEVLDTVLFHVRDITGALTDTIWGRHGALTFDPVLAAPLAEACHGVADTVDRGDATEAERHRAVGRAARSVRQLVTIVDARTLADGSSMGPGVLCAMHLRRILLHLQPVGPTRF